MRPPSQMKSLAADPLLNSVFEGEVLQRLSGGKRCLWNDIDVWRPNSPNGVELLNAARLQGCSRLELIVTGDCEPQRTLGCTSITTASEKALELTRLTSQSLLVLTRKRLLIVFSP